MLKLIYAPDPILKKESVSIPQVDDHHRELIKRMYDVMYSANGVGLAAPQIGLNIRIFILDAGSRDEEKKPITIINPKIISLEMGPGTFWLIKAIPIPFKPGEIFDKNLFISILFIFKWQKCVDLPKISLFLE